MTELRVSPDAPALAQAVAEAARAAHAAGQTPEQAVIALERQAEFAPLLAGGEGNTPRARALAAVTAAFAELDR